MKELKIKNNFTLNEVVNLFERESLIVKLIKELKLTLSKLILMLIVLIIITILLKSHIVLKILISIFSLIIIVVVIFLNLNRIFKNFNITNINKKICNLKDFSNILKEAEKKDFELLNKILKVNKLDKIPIIDSMIEYYKQYLEPEEKPLNRLLIKIIEYFFSIVIGILGIYISIYSMVNLELTDLLLRVFNIVEKGIVIAIITLIICIIYKLKNYSIRYNYTYNKIYKLLLEIKIYKLSKNNKKRMN